MVTKHAPASNATMLAELVDNALAGEWQDEGPVLVLMRQDEAAPDKVEIALKRIEDDPALEMMVFGPDQECLAVCLSRLQAAGPTGTGPVARLFPARITVAMDPHDEVAVIRHADGRTERPERIDGSCAQLLRESLSTIRLRS